MVVVVVVVVSSLFFSFPFPFPIFSLVFVFVFVQCLYKSFGATLLDDDWEHFDGFVKNILQKSVTIDSIESPATVDECPTAKKTLYEYFFDCNRKVWIAYDWIVPQYIHNVNLKFNEVFVPTADTIRINQILNQLSNVSMA